MKIVAAGLTWETPAIIDKLVKDEEKSEFEEYAKKLLEKTIPMLVSNIEIFFARSRALQGLGK